MIHRLHRISLAMLILILACLSLACAAFAENEYRAITVANEPKPLLGSLNQQQTFDPIETTPDALVAALSGQTLDSDLLPLFELLRFTGADDVVQIGQEDGSYTVLNRSEDQIQRQSFDGVVVAGIVSNIEIVYFGMPYYNNYAFIFSQSEGQPWRLIDCIFNYADAEIEINSRMTWLVGHGEQSGTQEGIRFDTWYNPHTRRVEMSLITSGNQIASWDADRSDVVVMSRSTYYNYTYPDEAGQLVDDTAVSVVKYVALENTKDMYAEDSTQLIQLDAYQQLDIYTFDADKCALTLAWSRQFENASPALLEGYTYSFFLDDQVTIPE